MNGLEYWQKQNAIRLADAQKLDDEKRERIKELIYLMGTTIRPQMAEVLEMRYAQGMDFSEIAKYVRENWSNGKGTSTERIRQMHDLAIKRLKQF